VAKGLHFDCRS